MKRFLGIACILINGYASADVFHPDNLNIRGHIGSFGDDVCFNNDGSTDSVGCPTISSPNEGYVWVESGDWNAGFEDGINACGTIAVDPVSSATCPFKQGGFASCTPNQFVLVQTVNSGHHFALKAGDTCGDFNRPESEVIFPCLSTDAFDPATGCGPPNPDPTQMGIENGYIKLGRWGSAPSASHCEQEAHEGRMVVDSVSNWLYVCTASGWSKTQLVPPAL